MAYDELKSYYTELEIAQALDSIKMRSKARKTIAGAGVGAFIGAIAWVAGICSVPYFGIAGPVVLAILIGTGGRIGSGSGNARNTVFALAIYIVSLLALQLTTGSTCQEVNLNAVFSSFQGEIFVAAKLIGAAIVFLIASMPVSKDHLYRELCKTRDS